MDDESKDTGNNLKEPNHIIFGHEVCLTPEAKWLCIKDLYQKFYRPNLYDIGGTYVADVADFWFMYKTEQVGNIFLLHLFVSNRQEESFTVSVSYSNELQIDKKNKAVYLPTSLKKYYFQKPKEMSQHYLSTYSFTDLDVDFMKDRLFHIAVSFPVTKDKNIEQEYIDNVKIGHDFGALLTDPIGSDFTIESGDGETFKVHKALLANHSEVFKAMLKEDTAESQNSFVKLVDVSAEDLHRILEFIYTGTVKDLINSNFLNLLMLADRFNLNGLRELSQYVLAQQLSVDTAIEVLMIADIYNSEALKMKALKFIKKNPCVLETNAFKEMNNTQLVRELCSYLVPL